MYEELRSEMRRQHKNIKGLADWMGKTPDAVSKKMQGVNPWRIWEAYRTLEYIEKPLSDMPIYFPRYEVWG